MIRYFVLGVLGTGLLACLVLLIIYAKDKQREYSNIILGICIFYIFFIIAAVPVLVFQ